MKLESILLGVLLWPYVHSKFVKICQLFQKLMQGKWYTAWWSQEPIAHWHCHSNGGWEIWGRL